MPRKSRHIEILLIPLLWIAIFATSIFVPMAIATADSEHEPKRILVRSTVTPEDVQTTKNATAEEPERIETQTLQEESSESEPEHELTSLKKAREDMENGKLSMGSAYGTLSQEEKEIYYDILKGLLSLEPMFVVRGDNPAITHVMQMVIDDHPEIWWVNGTYVIHTTAYDKKVSLENIPSETEIETIWARLDEAAENILADTKNHDIDLAWTAYTRIIKSVVYNEDATNGQNVIGGLIDHSTVCTGYAKAFQYTMQHAGIQCGVVRGVDDAETHMWCVTKIGDAWYHIDPTWGDDGKTDSNGKVLPEFFGMSDAQLDMMSRTMNEPANVPKCPTPIDETNGNEWLIIKSEDQQELENTFTARAATTDNLIIRFENDMAWQKALDDIDADMFLDNTFRDVAKAKNLKSIRYTIRINRELHTVELEISSAD